MAVTLAEPQDRKEKDDLAVLRDLLIEEKHRVQQLLRRVENVLRQKERMPADARDNLEGKNVPAPRASALDQMKNVMTATKDLRLPNGKLSANRVGKLYGISLSQLAAWLGRTKQAVSKTPDADSLQNALGYFERVARLRVVTENDAEFRKWLRMPKETLGNRAPLDLMKAGLWQEVADKVDDMLTGMPT